MISLGRNILNHSSPENDQPMRCEDCRKLVTIGNYPAHLDSGCRSYIIGQENQYHGTVHQFRQLNNVQHPCPYCGVPTSDLQQHCETACIAVVYSYHHTTENVNNDHNTGDDLNYSLLNDHNTGDNLNYSLFNVEPETTLPVVISNTDDELPKVDDDLPKAAVLADVKIDDHVQMRDYSNQSWNDGIVTSIDPLKVRYMWDREISWEWNQVRRPVNEAMRSRKAEKICCSVDSKHVLCTPDEVKEVLAYVFDNDTNILKVIVSYLEDLIIGDGDYLKVLQTFTAKDKTFIRSDIIKVRKPFYGSLYVSLCKVNLHDPSRYPWAAEAYFSINEFEFFRYIQKYDPQEEYTKIMKLSSKKKSTALNLTCAQYKEGQIIRVIHPCTADGVFGRYLDQDTDYVIKQVTTEDGWLIINKVQNPWSISTCIKPENFTNIQLRSWLKDIKDGEYLRVTHDFTGLRENLRLGDILVIRISQPYTESSSFYVNRVYEPWVTNEFIRYGSEKYSQLFMHTEKYTPVKI